jgi:hypothetical protein
MAKRVVVIVVAVAVLTILIVVTVNLAVPRVPFLSSLVVRSEISNIVQQVEFWIVEHDHGSSGFCLPDDFDLDVLSQAEDATIRRYHSRHPYLRPRDLIDPWGNPYVLRRDSPDAFIFTIMSYGPNGRYGGGDDRMQTVLVSYSYRSGYRFQSP